MKLHRDGPRYYALVCDMMVVIHKREWLNPQGKPDYKWLAISDVLRWSPHRTICIYGSTLVEIRRKLEKLNNKYNKSKKPRGPNTLVQGGAG